MTKLDCGDVLVLAGLLGVLVSNGMAGLYMVYQDKAASDWWLAKGVKCLLVTVAGLMLVAWMRSQ